ncbi:Surface polysaccharide O-acyltransferase, integral membrane enzyme [Salinibacillus kushneri]|uniref:Surface polysaccharide O-acyltransferase, integral membrane enzyme n=1 Tax=Salinibacillus kushneri TaxID=237682 RepID=A0A1H9ZFF6_9BACI|nr:acyltransferase [Salinibacillus kushneri]SES80328.1 Surface polysaccharide O-acyltransferase, integral membrane enzyme [Salinibacillus kushneri]
MERNYAIDYFKFFAMFFIVCIHTSPFDGSTFLGINGAHISFLIDTFARFGVPFFFMVSGYLLGQKLLTTNNNKVYFRKYLKKLVKLFLYWYLFYVLYGLAITVLKAVVNGVNIKTEVLSYLTSYFGIEETIRFILYGDGAPSSYQLWYLPALIWCVLIVYVFAKLNKLNILLCISLCLNIIGLFGQTYSGIYNLVIFDVNVPTRDGLFFGLLYTTLGCSFAYHYNWIKQKLSHIKSLTLIILFLIFSLTQLIERRIAIVYWPDEIRGEDFYVSTIFLSIVLFLFVMKNNYIGRNSVLSKIGKNAVGIYVSHTVFINLTNLFFDYLDINIREYFIFHLLFTPLVFITAYLFYNTLQIIKQKVRVYFKNMNTKSINNFD